MVAQDLLIIFLILLVMLTAIEPMLSSGKKKQKNKLDVPPLGVIQDTEPMAQLVTHR